jgi:drug/metabolite transporter (DMT)-like permease
MLRSDERSRGVFYILVSVLSLSVAPTMIKVGLSAQVDPILLLAWRLVISAGFLWLVFALFRRRVLAIDGAGLRDCALVGMANGTSLLCYYLALARINASIAHIIFSLYPLIALLMLALRGEPLTAMKGIRLGFALVGVYLLIGPGGQVDLVGASLVMGTAIFYALHYNLIQWRLGAYPPQTSALYAITVMAVYVSAVHGVLTPNLAPISSTGWWVIVGTALVSTVVARLGMFAGIRLIGSGQAALLGPLETLLAVMWAVLLLGERLSAMQWLGGLLILASAGLMAVWSSPAGGNHADVQHG